MPNKVPARFMVVKTKAFISKCQHQQKKLPTCSAQDKLFKQCCVKIHILYVTTISKGGGGGGGGGGRTLPLDGAKLPIAVATIPEKRLTG